MPTGTERVRSIHTADGGIVLDIRRGKIFSLNATGSVIFELLQQGLAEDRIVEELVKRFGVLAETARTDVADFCRSLRERALLATSSDRVSE
jgi:hypothetical protein